MEFIRVEVSAKDISNDNDNGIEKLSDSDTEEVHTEEKPMCKLGYYILVIANMNNALPYVASSEA